MTTVYMALFIFIAACWVVVCVLMAAAYRYITGKRETWWMRLIP